MAHHPYRSTGYQVCRGENISDEGLRVGQDQGRLQHGQKGSVREGVILRCSSLTLSPPPPKVCATCVVLRSGESYRMGRPDWQSERWDIVSFRYGCSTARGRSEAVRRPETDARMELLYIFHSEGAQQYTVFFSVRTWPDFFCVRKVSLSLSKV